MNPKNGLRALLIVFSLALSCVAADLVDNRPANEGGKRIGTQEQVDQVIRELNENLERYKTMHSSPALHGEELRLGRQWAFEHWAADHRNDPSGQGSRFESTMNLEVPSNLGVVDLDWLASIGNRGDAGRGPAGVFTYVLGKSAWFADRTIKYRDALPNCSSVLNLFPDTNWRAVAIADLLSSGRASAEEVFRAGRESAAVKVERAKLNTYFRVVENWGWHPSNFTSPNVWTPPAVVEGHRGAAMTDATRRNPRSSGPAPVGGVALGGAGLGVRGFGEIEGFRLNESAGALELLTKLPAGAAGARSGLDDLVTVFRAVYRGDGPSISIDPQPQAPLGPVMNVVPDDQTAGSWVEFVLLECDRLMKSYGLGADNISKRPIHSAIAGYEDILNGTFAAGGEGAENWERFWIVPIAAREISVGSGPLRLLEVPLQVQTRRCVWENGRLVDAVADPTLAGRRFAAWFTANLDGVGREAVVPAPNGSGVSGPVNVFGELRRIASLTAVAEYCRRAGQPLPPWMAQYDVRRVDISSTTPSLLTHRAASVGSKTVTTLLFGGVEMKVGPHREEVNVATLPSARQAREKERATEIGKALDLLPEDGPVATRDCVVAGDESVAIRVPLGEARDIRGCQLHELDLTVPLPDGRKWSLTRCFNSLVPAQGPWGEAWTLGLPRLEKIDVQVAEAADSRTILQGFDVISPQDGRICRLNAQRLIPELNVEGLVPSDAAPVVGLVRGKPRFWTATTEQLHLKDGDTWHFDAEGRFVASESPRGDVIAYERDSAGRLNRVIAQAPGAKPIEIKISCDDRGRMRAAVASRDSAVLDSAEYCYGADGRLQAVRHGGQIVSYDYSAGRVAGRTCAPADKKTTRPTSWTWDYDDAGFVRAETTPDGDRLYTEVTSQPNGAKARVFCDAATEPVATVEFDRAFRPTRTVFADGTEFLWKLQGDAPELAAVTDRDGNRWSLATLDRDTSDR